MVLVVRCSLCGDILECSKSNRQALFDHIREKHPNVALDTCQDPSKAVRLGADSKCILNELMHEADEVGNDSTGEGQLENGSKLNVSDKKRVSISSPKNGEGNKNSQRPSQIETRDDGSLPPRSSSKHSQNEMRQKSTSQNSPRQSQNNGCPRPVACPRTIKPDADVLYEREYKYKKPLSQQDLNKKKKIKNPKLYRTTVEKWRPGISRIYCPKCGEIRRPIIKSTQNRVSKSSAGAACILTCWPFCFLPFLFPPPTHENLYCRECDFFLGIYDHKNEKAEPNEEIVCQRISKKVEE